MSQHAVQLYQDEEDIAESLAQFAAEGLALGEGVLVIAGSARWMRLNERLRAGGVKPHAAMLRGQLRLAPLAFDERIREVLEEMRRRYPATRVFSSLSDVLWREGRHDAACAIERFWGGVAGADPLSILCACPLDSLDGRAYEGALQSVCRLHTHLLPARDCEAFDEAVSSAVREVLEPRLVGMLQTLSERDLPATQMPAGQAVVFWLQQHMPRTAEKVLARARARL